MTLLTTIRTLEIFGQNDPVKLASQAGAEDVGSAILHARDSTFNALNLWADMGFALTGFELSVMLTDKLLFEVRGRVDEERVLRLRFFSNSKELAEVVANLWTTADMMDLAPDFFNSTIH